MGKRRDAQRITASSVCAWSFGKEEKFRTMLLGIEVGADPRVGPLAPGAHPAPPYKS